ncbi:MAG: YcfL family protein [Campylobacter sp.]|uniref:YcfL family protein n=1 Tax=Campylobacter sp. TaxID=205 RepID=UPI002A8BF038|nr:YcfL family protein [Campylobacter sp.]MCI6344023.1 YcfL family protein [Campylobacter sp.]MCI6819451.1 YcfL family protein [Campylobacter sp.]MCI7362512.1 YcfL family protein [Campylobacter sp.]MDY4859681.1 YcfL family protein [Campylobacter sp.]
MKKFTILLFGLLFVSCANNQDVVLQDRIYDSSLVSFESIDMDIVSDIRKKFNALGLLQAQVILKSKFDKTIFYKIDWLDESGFVLRNSIDEHYHSIELKAHREFVLNKIAQDKRAKSFKIYFTSKGSK